MNADSPHVLIVDDDRRLRTLLQKYLAEHGFVVSTAENAADAEARLRSLAFDLMIVDVMMPDEDGMSFTRRIRHKSGIPVIMLTARGEGDDRIAGLESGADDYVPKPFEPRELILRMHSVLQRGESRRPAAGIVTFGPFTFDPERLELLRDGRPVPLTSREAVLLQVFAGNPGTTLSRLQLSRRSGSGERTVDVQVARLRRKIEENPRAPRYLRTVWGRGYVLRTDGPR